MRYTLARQADNLIQELKSIKIISVGTRLNRSIVTNRRIQLKHEFK